MTVTDQVVGIGIEPETAQQVYRTILNALSRPGLPHTLPATSFPPALLPTLALADLGTGIAVLDDGDTDWGEVLAVATGAPIVAADAARYLTVLRPVTTRDLLGAVRGTALSPESASTVVCAVRSLSGGTPVELTGPGIRDVEHIAPNGFDETLWNARNEATSAFPTGIDVLFVADDGTVLGVPRTSCVRIDKEN